MCENLCRSLNVPKLKFEPIEVGYLQPGRACEVKSKGQSIGWIGEIHPKLAAKFEIDKAVAAFELDAKCLLSSASEIGGCDEISQFPSVSMDVAFIVEKDITNEVMMQRITSAGGNLLKSVKLFDVYDNEKHVGAGKKQLAYSLEYNNPQKTLTNEEVETIHNKLVEKVCKSTGAKLRS